MDRYEAVRVRIDEPVSDIFLAIEAKLREMKADREAPRVLSHGERVKSDRIRSRRATTRRLQKAGRRAARG